MRLAALCYQHEHVNPVAPGALAVVNLKAKYLCAVSSQASRGQRYRSSTYIRYAY